MLRLLLLASILLAGCSLTTSILMKCKGDCELAVERDIQSTPALPLPIPKGE